MTAVVSGPPGGPSRATKRRTRDRDPSTPRCRRCGVGARAGRELLRWGRLRVVGRDAHDRGAQHRVQPGSSPGSSTDAGTEPSPPDETATTPAPVPAGIELVEATSAVTAPEGWTPAEALVDYASSADGPARYDALQLADRPSLSGSSDIDELAASFRSSLPEDARLERLPDLDLAGSPAYHFHWTVPGDPVVYDSVSTLRNGRSITLDFFLNRSTATEQPQLVDSVLGTFRWL